MINHEGCPQEVVQAKKKEITNLYLGLRDTQKASIDAHKYKRIRIYERKKVRKKLRWLRKRRDEGEDVEDEITKGYQELNYVLYFPPGKVYLSLYPKSAYNEDTLQRIEELKIEAAKIAESRMKWKEKLRKEKLEEEKINDEKEEKLKKDDFFVVENEEADEPEKSERPQQRERGYEIPKKFERSEKWEGKEGRPEKRERHEAKESRERPQKKPKQHD